MDSIINNQIVFYRSLTQPCVSGSFHASSCELLSNCILSIFDTADPRLFGRYVSCELLSNCILSIFDTAYAVIDVFAAVVVNCFQIVFYRSLTQLPLQY